MTGSAIVRALSRNTCFLDVKLAEMHGAAEAFLADAEALGARSSPGQYLLIAHSSELALKAYLYRNGFTLDGLQYLAQDLTKLLNEARRSGLATSNVLTDNILFRLKQAIARAATRCEFSVENLPTAADVIPVARSLLRDTTPELANVCSISNRKH
jgi:hypothetical protein